MNSSRYAGNLFPMMLLQIVIHLLLYSPGTCSSNLESAAESISNAHSFLLPQSEGQKLDFAFHDSEMFQELFEIIVDIILTLEECSLVYVMEEGFSPIINQFAILQVTLISLETFKVTFQVS